MITATGDFWRRADDDAKLADALDSSIEVWRANFTDWQAYETRFASTLSEAELQRARRFRDPALARHYITGRGLLRRLLSKYLVTSPEAIQLVTNVYGKPALPAGAALQFNVAHSGDVLLCAFTRSGAVGVDVERIDAKAITLFEARRILSDDEWKNWQRLGNAERVEQFFRTWVRKEAVLKALGVGLQTEPDSFAVGFGDAPRLLTVEGTRVRIQDLPMETPIKAAVALIGAEMPLIKGYVASASDGVG